MSAVLLARPEIRALSAYDAAAAADGTLRLNANELPDASSDGNYRRPLNRYPDVRPLWLQRALAGLFSCTPDQLLVTRGSSEAIDLAIRAFCRAGRDNIVIPSPSFVMYRHFAEIQGAAVTEVACRAEDDFRIDARALLKACTTSTRLLFVCSPNNPTGTLFSRRDLITLIESRAEQSVVVVDEAYIEFSTADSMTDMLQQYPNLLILRTLSKALGFAGARCGAVIGNPDVVQLLGAVQAPYALATPVIECVEDALQSEYLAGAAVRIQAIKRERIRLAEALASRPVISRVWPSEANFLLIGVQDVNGLLSHCEARGILLRSFAEQLPGCIRVTVGNQQENDCLLQAIDSFAESRDDQ